MNMHYKKISCLIYTILLSIFAYNTIIFIRYCKIYLYNNNQWMPIVIWHGMGDSCCNPLSIGRFMNELKETMGNDSTGNYVHINSIKIGDDIVKETLNGYFMNVNKQVELACQLIKNDEKLSNGYNAIGFSQGAQFLRAVAQRCPSPKMHNLISIGGQHQGVYGFPHVCVYPDNKWCDYIRKLLDEAAYVSFVQNNLVQAEYWHDPLNLDEYKFKSVFLADINNEVKINQTYISNFQQLNNLVLVMFNNDTMVIPKESSWFGFYEPGQTAKITDLWHSSLYTEDRLGLKSMEAAGKLHFLQTNGDHLRFTWDWFNEEIIKPYLSVELNILL